MPADVFISYHTDSAGEAVDKIAIALESAGIKCWYAPRNVEGNYAGSITKAIRNCRIFLLILNSHYIKSEHCLNEINIACGNENINIIPFNIEEIKVTDLSDDLFYYIGRKHFMDGGKLPPEFLKIRELVDRCIHILDDKPRENRENTEDNFRYSLTSSLAYPDTRFVGRRDELNEIRQRLSSGINKLFLVGMGGIGKSETAKVYLKEYTNDYSKIVWIPYADNLACSLGNDNHFFISGISRTDYPNDSDEAYGLRKMDILKNMADKRVLIVIDNFDTENDPYLDRFLSGSYSVIFTTRIHHEGKNELAIDALKNEKELFDMFLLEYTREITPTDRNFIENIIGYVEGHTLSVRLIASAMQKNRIRPEKMLAMLKNNLSENTKVSEQLTNRIRAIFRLSTLSDEEKNLLMNLSLFPNSGIEVEKLHEWCELDDYEIIDSLIARNWIIHDNGRDIIHLHPLIAEIMLEELRKYPEVCNTTLENYCEEFKWNVQYPLKKRVRLNELSRSVYERLPQNHPKRLDVLMIRVLSLYHLSQYQKGFAYCRLLIDSGKTSEQRLFGYVRLCHGLTLSGYYEEALKVGKAGKKFIENIDIHQCGRYEAYLYRNIIGHTAEAQNHCGDYEGAYKDYFFLRELSRTIYKFTPEESMGWAEFHLTQGLIKLKRYEEAEQMVDESILHFEQCGCDYGVSFSLWSKSFLLARKGNHAEAENCLEKTLEVLIPMIGKENVDIAKTYHYQSKIRIFARNAEGAAESLEHAKQIYEKLGFSVYAAQAENELARLKAGQLWEPDIF